MGDHALTRRTFGGEESLLGCRLIVDRIEAEREILGIILGIRDLDNCVRTLAVDTVCPNYHVLVCLRFLQERPYSGNDADRHDEEYS